MGNVREALQSVRRVLDMDPRWANVLRSLPGLRSLRGDPRFERLMDDAMTTTKNLALTDVPDAQWSLEGLRRHEIPF